MVFLHMCLSMHSTVYRCVIEYGQLETQYVCVVSYSSSIFSKMNIRMRNRCASRNFHMGMGTHTFYRGCYSYTIRQYKEKGWTQRKAAVNHKPYSSNSDIV